MISQGYGKWFNYTEKSYLYPDPLTYSDWRISTKLDGSLIIVSRHNGELIVRTRGVVNVDIHDTGPEIRGLVERYKLADCPLLDSGHSLLCEHTTPSNQIVLRYDWPQLTLLDVVRHDDCSYLLVEEVDEIAGQMGIPRPVRHSFGSLDEIAKTLKTLKDVEGYVLAYANNRHRVKCKTEDYLLRHRMRSAMSTIGNVLDYWFTLNPRPITLAAFFAEMERSMDHEIAKTATVHMSQILYAHDQVERGLAMTKHLVQPLKTLSRRDAALDIQARHVKHFQPAAFTYLSGREVDDKQRRKLIEWMLDQPVCS